MNIKDKKKILIFSTAYLPLIGGAELAVKEITARLGDDLIFDIICAKIDKGLLGRETLGGVEVRRVGRGWGKIDKFLLPWRGFNLAKCLYPKQKYDLIWAVMASFGGLAALFFKEQFSGAPYLLTLQEGDTPEHIWARAKWLGPYYSRMFKKADYITAISNYLKDYAVKQGAGCPIEVVPNGVDFAKFQIPNNKFQINSKFQFSKLKTELGIKENEKVIITVSRLVEKNGIGDLIEALGKISETRNRVQAKLLILGGGPLERDLKIKTKNLKLEGKVIFLGSVPNEQVPQYLAISDVFVRPSLAEGLGNSFLEAMAAGVPVIGTPVGGIPDFLRDGETGLFCQIRNPQSIAEKLRTILENNELRQKIVSNAKELVIKNYNWDLIAIKMREIFNKLIL